jgi:hypothetical protein
MQGINDPINIMFRDTLFRDMISSFKNNLWYNESYFIADGLNIFMRGYVQIVHI